VAIGNRAGQENQGEYAVAVGNYAGSNSQGINAIAIGKNADSAGLSSTAIGPNAITTGDYGVAIGINCGASGSSIAIGTNAYLGTAGSITLNASVNPTIANQAGFFVSPVRINQSLGSVGGVLLYDLSSKEIVYTTKPEIYYSSSSNDPWAKINFLGQGHAFNSKLANNIMLFYCDNVPKAYVSDTGTFNAFSDIKLKENINLLPDVLDKVCQLEPKTFNFKSDNDKKLITGFIAQEVEPVFPDIISSAVGEDKSTTKGLNMSGLVPYLVSAVKSLNNKVTTLESELAEIKRTLASLVPPAITQEQ
jgi:hypothetical protein